MLDLRQVVLSKLVSNVLLELAPQDSEIRVSPYGPISELKSVRLNAFDYEVPAYAVFRLGCYVAESCPLSIPFTVFCHLSYDHRTIN